MTHETQQKLDRWKSLCREAIETFGIDQNNIFYDLVLSAINEALQNNKPKVPEDVFLLLKQAKVGEEFCTESLLPTVRAHNERVDRALASVDVVQFDLMEIARSVCHAVEQRSDDVNIAMMVRVEDCLRRHLGPRYENNAEGDVQSVAHPQIYEIDGSFHCTQCRNTWHSEAEIPVKCELWQDPDLTTIVNAVNKRAAEESQSDTPRTKEIMSCVRQAMSAQTHEASIALREGAECGIENLERELAVAVLRAEAAEKKLKSFKADCQSDEHDTLDILGLPKTVHEYEARCDSERIDDGIRELQKERDSLAIQLEASREQCHSLAARVKELEEDKARLDWLDANPNAKTWENGIAVDWIGNCNIRPAIDAAMKGDA